MSRLSKIAQQSFSESEGGILIPDLYVPEPRAIVVPEDPDSVEVNKNYSGEYKEYPPDFSRPSTLPEEVGDYDLGGQEENRSTQTASEPVDILDLGRDLIRGF